ncbi:hypothetical protein [Hymenobacter nivis]|uniref:hypothetical protein n=1 Tax=Hymenobacter nivis TaxID=1850093 RepID=UPI001128AA33|nr:hypothetical protein [Hymenobacter nivis]
MNPAKPKSDALAYLLGGVGVLAIPTVPLLAIGMKEIQPVGKLIIAFYWLLGGLALWWARSPFCKYWRAFGSGNSNRGGMVYAVGPAQRG